MREELIFHLVTTDDWKTFQNAGLYSPESLEEEGFIHCSTGNQVEKIANERFAGQHNLLLIVIDSATLESDVKYEDTAQSDQKFPHVYGPINIDSIIDKIKLEPDQEGLFVIQFSSSE